MSEKLSNCHVWGCPTYSLETNFQNPGLKTPRWDPIVIRGVIIGFIKMHSTKYGLVLNLLTTLISP